MDNWGSLDKYFKGYGFSANVEEQTNCVKNAANAGFTWGFSGLAGAAALVFGAGRLYPRFERSLSVSSKTGLIVMPFFALFFLQAELTLNECSQRKKLLARAMKQGLIQGGHQ